MDEEEMLCLDPNILLSWTNTMLRDKYDDLDDLCATHGFEKEILMLRLKSVGYKYDVNKNQFTSF